MLDLSTVNNDWTLFLDRDGVINHEKETYVFNTSEFLFYDGVLEALKKFGGIFKYVIVATNQRGVGRQLMTEKDLQDIHDMMLADIKSSGGRIDKIYYAISTDNSDPDRKPNAGMALRALNDFPQIDKYRCIMVGNNISDMQFGKNAGFYTVLLTTTGISVELPHPLVDLQFDSLASFAQALPARGNR